VTRCAHFGDPVRVCAVCVPVTPEAAHTLGEAWLVLCKVGGWLLAVVGWWVVMCKRVGGFGDSVRVFR
jgi:hypothetical protein